MVKLKGSAGTGKKILENWDQFRYQLNEEKSDSEFYCFNIKFGDQEGTFNILIKDGKVAHASTIDCDFDRPLGIYNDTSLLKVAKKMVDNN